MRRMVLLERWGAQDTQKANQRREQRIEQSDLTRSFAALYSRAALQFHYRPKQMAKARHNGRSSTDRDARLCPRQSCLSSNMAYVRVLHQIQMYTDPKFTSVKYDSNIIHLSLWATAPYSLIVSTPDADCMDSDFAPCV